MRKIILVLFMVVLPLAGCATAERGRAFDVKQAQKIEIGKTTESEVISMLGAPVRTKSNSNGEKKFRYAHVKANVVMGSINTTAQVLDISFDRNGVVKEIEQVR